MTADWIKARAPRRTLVFTINTHETISTMRIVKLVTANPFKNLTEARCRSSTSKKFGDGFTEVVRLGLGMTKDCRMNS